MTPKAGWMSLATRTQGQPAPPRPQGMPGHTRPAPPAPASDTPSPAPPRAAEAPDALTVRDFNLFYGAHHALKGVGLGVREHSVTAIIGPSGCGKSTLLRSFNRMNDLIPGVRTEGQVTVAGLDVRTANVVELRRCVGMVFERPNPFPKSIFDNVAFGLRLLGLRDRAELEARVEQSLLRAALWNQ